MKAILSAVVLSLALVGPAFAKAGDNQCVRRDAAKRITVAAANGGVVQNVLCCCSVGSGGQCCKYVSFCGGGFVPGCFCQQ